MIAKSISEFGQASENIITEALENVGRNRNYPHPVYHFTNIDGAKGILSSRSLWATRATASLDETEIGYALSLAKQLLLESRVSADPLPVSELISLLDIKCSQLLSDLNWSAYVVSFRANADGRGHWNEYGEAGKGIALAFGMKPIVVPGTLFLPVIYESTIQEQLIGQFIIDIAQLLKSRMSGCPQSDRDKLCEFAVRVAALGIWTLAPVIKAQRFHVEEEWRLIVINAEGSSHVESVSIKERTRKRGDRLIPYIVLKYDRLPIVSVELGSHAMIRNDDPFLVQLLRDSCSSINIPITRSCVTIADTIGNS